MHNLINKCHLEITEGGETNSEYVGITFNEGVLDVIFPRGYDLSESDKDIKYDVLLLIKAFDKYSRSKRSRIYSEEDQDLNTGKGNKFSLSNAIWFLNDYEMNGLYKEYKHRYKTDKKGDINWSRTIKSITPYVSNNNLVYLDYIVKEKNNDINNIILLIQKYIIEKSINIIGWLYPSIQIEGVNPLPYKRSICMNLLSKELRLVNDDKTKRLIVRMIDFLENDGNEEDINSLREYKTKYFEHIWEDMLNDVLGNDDPSKYYPRAVWHIDGYATEASNLMPDTILKTDKAIYVIDAKYYKYGITNLIKDLPQSSDITKQMLYSKYIKTLENKNSYDAFILPYNSNNQDAFKFIGYSNIKINEFKENKVLCILADIKIIIERYVYGNKLYESKQDIIEIINKNN